jgi:mRNA-degrading endonuclease RelE of RelBE toxin-antitoxin system
MFIATASGKVFALTTGQYDRIGWALRDLQVGESRLAERDTPYRQYRARRLGAGALSAPTDFAVSVSRSSQKDMDRFDASLFARLDDAILALSKHPTPRGRKRLKWLNPDLWAVRGTDFLLVYAIDSGVKRVRILKISYCGKGVSRPRQAPAKRTAAPKPRDLTRHTKPAGASADKGLSPIDLDWQDGYSGQTVEELLAFEKHGKTELLAAAFAQAIREKFAHRGRLSETERVVLAVGALDSAMVTDGIDNFFTYSPQFASTIVNSLLVIGCKRIAKITQRALDVLRLPNVTAKRVYAAMMRQSEERDQELQKCSASYWKAPGPSRRLLAFIKTNKHNIRF